MRYYAILKENYVIKVVQLENEEVQEVSTTSEMIVDIEDQTPRPEVGWILIGNKIVEPNLYQQQVNVLIESRLNAAIDFGKALKKEMAIKIGRQNLLTGKGENDITVLVSSLMSIGNLLEGGALRTAKNSIQAMRASYPEYDEHFNLAINKIKVFLNE